jgi:hypothetical protein
MSFRKSKKTMANEMPDKQARDCEEVEKCDSKFKSWCICIQEAKNLTHLKILRKIITIKWNSRLLTKDNQHKNCLLSLTLTPDYSYIIVKRKSSANAEVKL